MLPGRKGRTAATCRGGSRGGGLVQGLEGWWWVLPGMLVVLAWSAALGAFCDELEGVSCRVLGVTKYF